MHARTMYSWNNGDAKITLTTTTTTAGEETNKENKLTFWLNKCSACVRAT